MRYTLHTRPPEAILLYAIRKNNIIAAALVYYGSFFDTLMRFIFYTPWHHVPTFCVGGVMYETSLTKRQWQLYYILYSLFFNRERVLLIHSLMVP